MALDGVGPRERPAVLLPLRTTPRALAAHVASQTLAVLCAPAASRSDQQAGGASGPGCGGMLSSSGGEGSGGASELAGSRMNEEESAAGTPTCSGGGTAGDSGDERGSPSGQHRNGSMVTGPGPERGGGAHERGGRCAVSGVGAQGEGARGRCALHELRCIDPATGARGLHAYTAGGALDKQAYWVLGCSVCRLVRLQSSQLHLCSRAKAAAALP